MFTHNEINRGSYMLKIQKQLLTQSATCRKLIFNVVEKWDSGSNAFHCIMILLIEKRETK